MLGCRINFAPKYWLILYFHLRTSHICNRVPQLKEHNIYAVYDSPSSLQRNDAASEIEAAMNTAIVCFLFDFIGIFSGSSLFINKVNLLQIILHFAGGILLATYIQDAWAFTFLWPLVIAFNMTSALVEASVLFGLHVLKVANTGD